MATCNIRKTDTFDFDVEGYGHIVRSDEANFIAEEKGFKYFIHNSQVFMTMLPWKYSHSLSMTGFSRFELVD